MDAAVQQPGELGDAVTTAEQKWLQLGLDILAHELRHANDGQLLSEACDRWIDRNPVAARVCIVSVGGLLIAHLANLIDKDYDVVGPQFWRRNRKALQQLIRKAM